MTEDEYIEFNYQQWQHRTGPTDRTTSWAELVKKAYAAGWHAGRSYSDDLPPWRGNE